MLQFKHVNDNFNNVSLPKRATTGSSGYDFYAPKTYEIKAGQSVLIETGIKFITDDPSKWLMLMPRSGMGFKYGFRLLNTVGNVDSDYQYAENGGHIMAKVTADVDFTIKEGEKFMQGVFVPCYFVDDDDATGIRTGGFGSTGK